MEEHDEYVKRHPAECLTLASLWAEMDTIWDSFGLDNRKPLSNQPVSEFYAHPVWVVNGLFSAADPESLRHRIAIAQYAVKRLKATSVADYGGGIGELARQISIASENAVRVDIIEPYPSKWRIETAAHPNATFRPDFHAQYDLVVAQDVLEHIEDPIDVTLRMIEATRFDGHLIFANCFYPVIKCHLPGTFYLRHTFRIVMKAAGLNHVGRIPGATHAECYRRARQIDRQAVSRADRLMRVCGPALNVLEAAVKLPVRAAGRLATA
jgi:2-polyprenyl-6-hydroxyphenyl methylase/3-demethylubiquinone-9 3-methyltransferase